MKIVIDDDSELPKKRIKESLKDIKKVDIADEANTGIEAIDIIRSKNSRLIPLDIRMLEMKKIHVIRNDNDKKRIA